MTIKRITGSFRVGAYCPKCNVNNSIPVEFFVSDSGKKLRSYKVNCVCGYEFALCLPKNQRVVIE